MNYSLKCNEMLPPYPEESKFSDVQVVKWIKCSERLPEPYENVLVFCDNIIFTGYITDTAEKYWKCFPNGNDAYGYAIFVTHWMPHPKPPEET